MPTYVLPKLKKRKESSNDSPVASSIENDQWRRQIQIPANSAILKSMSVGDEVEVTLKGKVTEITSKEGTEYKEQSFDVEVKSVSAYPNEEDEAEEAMQRGHSKLKRQY